jgi:hypothetical protein
MRERVLYWIPRVLMILALLFMLMFSFDAFDGNESFGRKILDFLLHNIPVFILTGIFVIAWKRELIGGLLLFAALIAASILFRSFSGNPASLIVLAPFAVAGVLFILHHFLYGESKV